MEYQKLEGRKGKSTEYVEFKKTKNSTRFIAQRGTNSYWFVFVASPGRKGYVKTVASFLPTEKEKAVKKAEQLIKREEF